MKIYTLYLNSHMKSFPKFPSWIVFTTLPAHYLQGASQFNSNQAHNNFWDTLCSLIFCEFHFNFSNSVAFFRWKRHYIIFSRNVWNMFFHFSCGFNIQKIEDKTSWILRKTCRDYLCIWLCGKVIGGVYSYLVIDD